MGTSINSASEQEVSVATSDEYPTATSLPLLATSLVTQYEHFDHDSLGDVRLVVHYLAAYLKWDLAREEWLAWVKGRWERGDLAARQLMKLVPRIRTMLGKKAVDDDARSAERKRAKELANKHARWTLLEDVKDEPRIQDDGPWDANPYLLGVQNGILEFDPGDVERPASVRLRPAHHEDRVTRYTAAPFDEDAPCPTWGQCLQDWFLGDDELIKFVQEMQGFSLLGITDVAKMIICLGEGANGKNTLLDTSVRVDGGYGVVVPAKAFLKGSRSWGAPTAELAAIGDKRHVISSETNQGEKFDAATLKAWVSGDIVSFRDLFKTQQSGRSQAHLWIGTNYPPETTDFSTGMKRRIYVVPFRAKFGEGGKSEVPHLKERLEGEFPGILAWKVNGAVRVLDELRQGRKPVPPEAVREATESYWQDQFGVIPEWAEECVSFENEVWTATQDLRESLRKWCDAHDLKCPGGRKLSAWLQSKDVVSKRNAAGTKRGWMGLRLRF